MKSNLYIFIINLQTYLKWWRPFLSKKHHSFTWKSIPMPKKWDHSQTFLSWRFRDVNNIFLHVLRGIQGLSKAKMTFAWQFTCLMTFAWQFTCLNNFGINHRYSGIGSPLFLWKKNSPFFSFFLVFLWLTCAISSDKSHYFISSEKSHYFLQFTIQPLPRSILIYYYY